MNELRQQPNKAPTTLSSVCIAGEVYSENLGDGAIAMSLAHLFKVVANVPSVSFLDISARRSIGERTLNTGQISNGKISVLGPVQHWVGTPLPAALKWKVLHRRKHVQYYRRSLRDDCLLVIGGGQLFRDYHLRFPLRLNELTRYAASRKIPTHFCACGVGESWSWAGGRLFRSALLRARTISVRDSRSKERIETLVPELRDRVVVVLDPAICAAAVLGITSAHNGGRPIAGIGIMSYTSLRREVGPMFFASFREYVHFWTSLAEALAESGFSCKVFTNGAAEDEATANEVHAAIRGSGRVPVFRAARPQSPRQLLTTLSTLDLVVAARLHSCVLAMSCAKATVGLSWDRKVAEFFREIGRGAQCVDISEATIPEVLGAVSVARERPILYGELRTWRERAEAAVNHITR